MGERGLGSVNSCCGMDLASSKSFELRLGSPLRTVTVCSLCVKSQGFPPLVVKGRPTSYMRQYREGKAGALGANSFDFDSLVWEQLTRYTLSVLVML
jgi:hypothetical protein